jgi:membrane protein involved in colicin uptake
MAPKTEEQNFLERLGVLDATDTHDSDFNVESAVIDNDYVDLAEELARINALEQAMEVERERLYLLEQELESTKESNKRESKRLKRWEKELAEVEATLEQREIDRLAADKDEKAVSLDDVAMDEYRKKKKLERLLKRSGGTDEDDEIRSVWSTGWNT